MLYRAGRPNPEDEDDMRDRMRSVSSDGGRYTFPPLNRSRHSKAKPIVFIHGIGIGFFPYLVLILCLPREVDVFLIEWHHVSMQLVCLLDPKVVGAVVS
jgi:hypothetical protein